MRKYEILIQTFIRNNIKLKPRSEFWQLHFLELVSIRRVDDLIKWFCILQNLQKIHCKLTSHELYNIIACCYENHISPGMNCIKSESQEQCNRYSLEYKQKYVAGQTLKHIIEDGCIPDVIHRLIKELCE